MSTTTLLEHPFQPKAAKPPRADINPIFGLISASQGNFLNFFLKTAEHERLVELPNPSGKLYLVNDAKFLERILLEQHRNYPKSDYYERLKPIFGNGLFELEGEAWRRKRKAFNPAFAPKHHDYYLRSAVTTARSTVNEILLHAGGQTDISKPFMRGTLNFIIDALCSSEVELDFGVFSNALATIMREGERTLWAIVPALRRLPGARKRHFQAAVKTFDELMYGLITKRLEQPPTETHDLLDMLIAQKQPETGELVSLRELRDDLLTVLVAGHETTALALSWGLYILSQSPEWRVRLEAEADQVDLNTLSFSDLKDLPVSRQIGQEALRLFPPLWSMSRKAIEADQLGEYEIPAGANLMISAFLLHRNKRYWHNPTAFDPSRFNPDLTAQRPKLAFFPFGAGPRVCIGKHLALMELQVFLLAVAQKCRCHLTAACDVVFEPMISLRPKHGLLMDIEAR